MNKDTFFNQLIPKDRDLDKIAFESVSKPEMVTLLFEGVRNKNVRIKYGCFNTLVLIAEKTPEILYPYFEQIVEYLQSKTNIFRLGGIKIIAHLSTVDDQNKFDQLFDEFYAFIGDPGMTGAVNVAKGSPVIANAKPYLTDRIVLKLLSVSKNTYKTEECKNILIGHVIVAFEKLFRQSGLKKEMIDFSKENLNNSWKGTKSKAEKFMKKFGVD